MNDENIIALFLTADNLQTLNEWLTAHAANSGQVREVKDWWEQVRSGDREKQWAEWKGFEEAYKAHEADASPRADA